MLIIFYILFLIIIITINIIIINQLTGFYMMTALVFNELIESYIKVQL